ncbi:hypothetical protein Rsub_10888 [Raphidocelis subcapitata]|uniref:SGNH hydrolase-type esterase domain-containing protein n=1 Tax=Raphidocelis subcapitata TaxID=307507 RepID=A0A2V0PCZ9_9CHLO|nr:hypothetical protein Rsub_10888 [Raphidocelis subcapitata]|eukprot:GBF97724.1 hypothetical protein Rsub_10888 [Raphidocelis subcapitata]
MRAAAVRRWGLVVAGTLLAASICGAGIGAGAALRAQPRAADAAAACKPAAPCAVRVLAMGDSLTEGYYSQGKAFHPYALKLRELLAGELAGSCRLVLQERGHSGERVMPSMQARLRRALEEAAQNGERYDFVLLLGGTNDIGTRASGPEVLTTLASMHEAAAAAGARAAAMTLPPFNTQLPADRAEAYAELNSGLRLRWGLPGAPPPAGPALGGAREAGLAAAVAPADGGGGAPAGSLLVDLEALLPVSAAELWDDHIHLSPAGYDLVGEALFEALRPHLAAAAAAAAARGPAAAAAGEASRSGGGGGGEGGASGGGGGGTGESGDSGADGTVSSGTADESGVLTIGASSGADSSGGASSGAASSGGASSGGGGGALDAGVADPGADGVDSGLRRRRGA